MVTTDCQGTRELQPGLLRYHHVFPLVCTHEEEPRDAKFPSTDSIPRFVIICGELAAAWGAELRKQHRPGPRRLTTQQRQTAQTLGSQDARSQVATSLMPCMPLPSVV